MPDVNYLAVALAALSAFVLGGLWYSPLLFAKAWVRLNGFNEEEMKKNANMAMISPDELVKNWMAFGAGAQEQFRKLMEAGIAGAAPKT